MENIGCEKVLFTLVLGFLFFFFLTCLKSITVTISKIYPFIFAKYKRKYQFILSFKTLFFLNFQHIHPFRSFTAKS